MTPQRALEVLRAGSQWSEFRRHMTPDEIAYVTAGWKQMPGWTCFHDALLRVSKQRHPFNPDGLLADVLHVMRTA
jgi:hypothetical protein